VAVSPGHVGVNPGPVVLVHVQEGRHEEKKAEEVRTETWRRLVFRLD
jgi:hypothetical protein